MTHRSSRLSNLRSLLPCVIAFISLTPALNYAGPVVEIKPGAAWNGIAGSGFGTSNPVPIDPARETAKPALRLATPPNQFFSDRMPIFIAAAANDNGSLLKTLGLASVRIHCEGNTIELSAPSHRTMTDVNGVERAYYGWHFDLRHPATGGIDNEGNGELEIYIEAVPIDSTMQRRLIGPFQWTAARFPDGKGGWTPYDYSLEVDPSNPDPDAEPKRFESIAAASDFCLSLNARNPLVTIIDAGEGYWLGGAKTYVPEGHFNITARVPVTFSSKEYTTDRNATVRTTRNLHIFGSNVTMDMRWWCQIYTENNATTGHWMDGIKFVHSGPRTELWRGGSRPIYPLIRHHDNFPPSFTECEISGIPDPCRGAGIVRGSVFTECPGDIISGTPVVIGNRAENCTSTLHWRRFETLTITYTGSAAEPTIEKVQGNVYVAKEGASEVGRFQMERSEEAYAADKAYWPEHLVNWVNNDLPEGWSATLQLPSGTGPGESRYRQGASLTMPGGIGRDFGPQNVKGVTFSLETFFDYHSDWFAQDYDLHENIIHYDNILNGVAVQTYILGAGQLRDALIFNNVFLNLPRREDFYLISQMSGAISHAVLAHNAWTSQPLVIREGNPATDLDSYCLIANNIAPTIDIGGDQSDPDTEITENHIMEDRLLPEGATFTSVGGTAETLFENVNILEYDPESDFTPAGALTVEENLKQPVLKYDLRGAERSSRDAAGPISLRN